MGETPGLSTSFGDVAKPSDVGAVDSGFLAGDELFQLWYVKGLEGAS